MVALHLYGWGSSLPVAVLHGMCIVHALGVLTLVARGYAWGYTSCCSGLCLGLCLLVACAWGFVSYCSLRCGCVAHLSSGTSLVLACLRLQFCTFVLYGLYSSFYATMASSFAKCIPTRNSISIFLPTEILSHSLAPFSAHYVLAEI